MKARSVCIIVSIMSFLLYSQIGNASVVRIHGVSLDSTVKFVKVIRPASFWWTFKAEPVMAEATRRANSNAFDLSFELDRPLQLWIQSSGVNWPIFCTPGDDVSFVISRNPHDQRYLIIKFDGQNSAQYNVINDLDDLGFRFSYPVFRGDPLAYRNSIDKWLGEKEKLFDNYKDQFQTNTAFIDYFTSTIAYERLSLLYLPLWREKIALTDFPSNYFDENQNLPFNNEYLLDIPAFRGALVSKYIYASGPAMWDNFDERYKMITSMKPGKIREYLTACLFGIYAKHESPQYEISLRKAMLEAGQFIKDSEYLAFISETQKDYLTLNRVFPDSIQDNTFLISIRDNKKITLKEMLNLFSEQAIYLDFWAQWCAPCRQDIRESKEAKNFLSEEKVAYVYLSIDEEKDIEKWRTASETDGITLNQYLLIDGRSSPLGKYLQVDYVPRYILIDENHKLKKVLAPRPIPSQLAALASSLKEMRMKVVTYK